jgi:hypothetical protein
MTYGHEVRCEDSCGHVLEGLLQPHIQVLNFAINAHGLNQALLRYEKDARLWKPQIVIIGISSAMITRNNNIYPFLKDPEWGFPFARSRFVMQHDKRAGPPRGENWFLFRHSHGGTGFGSAHSPRLSALATASNISNLVSEGAYFRNHQHQPSLTSVWLTLVPSCRSTSAMVRPAGLEPGFPNVRRHS